MSFFDSLRTASYRGVLFGVTSADSQFGRRNAVHQYPFRDEVWIEDLGRQARRINITGFLVENGAYGGGDVIAQRERLIAACESPGEGALIHPTLGRLSVGLMTVSTTEQWDKGRVFILHFQFIEAGKRIFPAANTSTTDAVKAAAATADGASAGDFFKRASVAMQQGSAVITQAVNTTTVWALKVQKLANDATNLYHAVQSLPGTFGRFFGGRRKGLDAFNAGIVGTGQSVLSLLALSSVAKRAVSTAASVATSTAGSLGQ
jgi:prophage DNA circulation protein